MTHTHSHSHTKGTPEKNLFITMMLNLLITVVQIAGGILSGSLSLISDAFHNLSDAAAIIVTYIALRYSRKPKTFKYTFGFKRAEILAAMLNASTLIIICFFMIKEAIERLQHPTAIEGSLMLIVAVIGLAANIIGTMLLKPGSQDNLNLRATYFHLLSDSIASVAIMIGAAGIIYFNIYWIDPVLTIGISLYIVREAYSIVKEAADVVMMSSPASIDIQEVRSVIEAISGVKNIHHVHIWKLNDADTHFEAHIEVENISTQEATEIQKLIERELHARYDIHHTTLQFECNKCTQQDIV